MLLQLYRSVFWNDVNNVAACSSLVCYVASVLMFGSGSFLLLSISSAVIIFVPRGFPYAGYFFIFFTAEW